jgi:hypothetical protein
MNRRIIALLALLIVSQADAQVVGGLFGKSYKEQVFTSSGTWTRPSSVSIVEVECQAPGGGGGGGQGSGASMTRGSGGGGSAG